MIRVFDEVAGRYIRPVEGQERYGYGREAYEDFYDMKDMPAESRRGDVLAFYDFETGEVFTPFPKEKDVLFGDPVYHKGLFYFLRGDFAAGTITLQKYAPGKQPEQVTAFAAADVDLYNLRLLGEGVNVVSENDERLVCYWPEAFTVPLGATETAVMIDRDRVWTEAWVEEGWDEEKDCPGPDYTFYNRVIARDFSGKTLHSRVGSLNKAPDGTWWIS